MTAECRSGLPEDAECESCYAEPGDVFIAHCEVLTAYPVAYDSAGTIDDGEAGAASNDDCSLVLRGPTNRRHESGCDGSAAEASSRPT